MALPSDFIQSLEFVHPSILFGMMKDKTWPRGLALVELTNEIKPVDLYCYLGGRFGQPNGMQNFLRKDDSDNLIHWEWTLRYPSGFVSFQGHNFRTEIHITGDIPWEASDREALIQQIKSDFGPRSAQLAEVRNALEHWIEFVNPYQRIRKSVDTLLEELDGLGLNPDQDGKPDVWELHRSEELKTAWDNLGRRYSKGFGLCFGIRSMLPVLAEAYVNLVLYVLMRPEIKNDQRLRENVFRQPIDVRIKSLAINCGGFQVHPDYTNEACKRYHRMVNERNDLLHGNVVVDKLRFNEVHFFGRVPIFREYRTMWERSLGVRIKTVGLKQVREELEIVDGLVAYIESCIAEPIRAEMRTVIEREELGVNSETQRIGILFPGHLVDMRMNVQLKQDGTDD